MDAPLAPLPDEPEVVEDEEDEDKPTAGNEPESTPISRRLTPEPLETSSGEAENPTLLMTPDASRTLTPDASRVRTPMVEVPVHPPPLPTKPHPLSHSFLAEDVTEPDGLDVGSLDVGTMPIPGVDEETLLPTEEMVLDEDLLNAINETTGGDFVDPTDEAIDTTMGDLVDVE